nr:leucine-rich repeat domain-containing protein [Paludibacteraceae bacterium]
SVTSIGQEAFTNCTSLTAIDIPNSVRSIEASTFNYCTALTKVTIGNKVKSIGDYAFYNCAAIQTITCHSMTTPSTGYNTFNGLAASTIVYVPADCFDDYANHEIWGQFDVRKIGSESAETDEVQVTPSPTAVDITWPAVPEAVVYELVISDTDGNIICTLTFNGKGQLLSIDFTAPDRNNAPDGMQAEGFRYTVTGLSSDTGYKFTITAKDADSNVLGTKDGSFKTPGTATDNKETDGIRDTRVRKVMRNGRMYILTPEGGQYDIQGAEVR